MRLRPTTTRSLFLAGGLLGALVSACSALVSFDGYVGGAGNDASTFDASTFDVAAKDTGTSATDATAPDGSDASTACPSGRGPSMVTVTGAASGISFCIDTTEVTNTEYAQFLDANDFPPQPSYCAWNTTYLPQGFSVDSANGQIPVTNVNWCDAYMFCIWAGKRLCGKIGGGAASTSSGADALTNQHYFACSNAGAQTYPYGQSYDPNACNGPDRAGGGALVNVASLPTCEGGFPGLFDLSYNAGEWQDACDGTSGANDQCLLVEGTFGYPTGGGAAGGACGYTGTLTRNQIYNDNGFRCCGP